MSDDVKRKFIDEYKKGLSQFIEGCGGPEVVLKLHSREGADPVSGMVAEINRHFILRGLTMTEAEDKELRSAIAGCLGLM